MTNDDIAEFRRLLSRDHVTIETSIMADRLVGELATRRAREKAERDAKEKRDALSQAPHLSRSDDGTEIAEWLFVDWRFGVARNADSSWSWFFVSTDSQQGGSLP